ncbi:optineurin isoform X1 [Synchiropus splendidus]|uniref:optineurin isoform X1 n=2 Tax=Synchiropus splendidus TaxID=270530 RepID=UPI00237EE300|nr:optineurin isoform X1 [Synchiropus splendidus]
MKSINQRGAIMSSGAPVMNGDVARSPTQTGTLEDTLLMMNNLIRENRDLKVALRDSNQTMKERFDDLSAWRNKQLEERNFLESRLDEARVRIETLTLDNKEMKDKLEESERVAGTNANRPKPSSTAGPELETLKTLVARLQAEKNDLVAMNSELQLKADQESQEDFIEVIKVTDSSSSDGVSDSCESVRRRRPEWTSAMASRMDNEELTVSQLLQSLRNETKRAETLEAQLRASVAKIRELEEEKSKVMESTQTSLTPEVTQEEANSEVENLKAQMRSLFEELQQAQIKLDKAESMKKNLQDKYREVEQDVVTLKAQLMQKQAVQQENERLKLQLDSMQAQSLIEQRKAGDERNNLAQLKDAYTKLFEDYSELKEENKKREGQFVKKEMAEQLQEQLTEAEKALAAKQERIDIMKQELYQKEKDEETISVYKTQAEIYSSDFYAEREARTKLHEEKERLATQLEIVRKQNMQLQEEMESLSRRSLSEIQRRHVGGNAAGSSLVGRGPDWQDNIPEHVCPKCNEILPDLDSLQIHIMDCIN